MKSKRHHSKLLVLDNCTLLKDLEVKLPEELFYFEDKLKEFFKTLEEFYAKFFKIEGFVKDLSVIFYLHHESPKSAEFDCCDCKTNKPVIKMYDPVCLFEFGNLAHILAREFAQFIDWKLGMIKDGGGYISERKDTIENELTKKFLSFQKIKHSDYPLNDMSGKEMISPSDFYARYLEDYYQYCFRKDSELLAREVYKKNFLYVMYSDLESGLLETIKDYLEFYHAPEEIETVMYEGNLYSPDKKILLEILQKDTHSFVVPDFVEIIGKFAFHGCDSLKTVTGGKNVHFIMFGAFGSCRELESLKGFDNLEIVGMQAFINCWKLKKLPKFSNLKYVRSRAFGKLNFIKRIKILHKASCVEENAFF